MEVRMYRSEYDSFVTSPIWHEIVDTLKETKEGLLNDVAELDPFADATKLARQQGRLKMLEFVLALPDDILREIEENLEKKTEEKK
ncbi:MAG: hypothetical protein BWY21_01953 [Parcubacteria group bacterium ADurb.Bin216]|nr:MAG: hypothetical protein BWY21_01953 [Parcubacteria group bacterium ADurb.Bin216]